MPELTPPDPISSREFAERRTRVEALADEEGFDGLIVWARGGASYDWYADVSYFAGAVTPIQALSDSAKWTDRGHTVLVLPVGGDPVYLTEVPDAPNDEIKIPDIRLVSHLPNDVADVIRETSLAGKRLGLIGEASLRWSTYNHFGDAMGGDLSLEPADHLLRRLRYVKSPAEVAWCRYAHAVGVEWMNATMGAVEAGVTEGDVVGEGLKCLAAHGGDAYDVGISSGPKCDHYWSSWRLPHWDSERKLENGDLLHADLWGPVQGYLTDFSRSTVVGRNPSGEQRELLEAAVAAIVHIVDGVRPGVTWGDLYARGMGWYADHGFSSVSEEEASGRTSFADMFPSFGHSSGMVVETPFIIEDDPTVLEPGVVISIEHFLSRPGVGSAAHEHGLVVTENGYEILDAACPAKWWD